MAGKAPDTQQDDVDTAPDFFQKFREAFNMTASHSFILHGQIQDAADAQLVSIPDWLAGVLSAKGYMVVTYSLSAGFYFPFPSHAIEFGHAVVQEMPDLRNFGPQVIAASNKFGAILGNEVAATSPSAYTANGFVMDYTLIQKSLSLAGQIDLLDKALHLNGKIIPSRDERGSVVYERSGGQQVVKPAARDANGKPKTYKVCVIFPFADNIFVQADALVATPEMRIVNEFAVRWARDQQIRHGRGIIFYMSPSLQMLDRRLVEASYAIHVGIPRQEERLEVIHAAMERVAAANRPAQLCVGMDEVQLAILTAGMPRQAIANLITGASMSKETLSYYHVRQQKAAAIEAMANGTVRLLKTDPATARWDMVIGLDKLVRQFQIYVDQMLRGSSTMPRGCILAGPAGTGKTMLATIAASLSNTPALITQKGMLLGKYVGESERRAEIMMNTVSDMSPVWLVIDEGENMLGRPDSSFGDSGVSQTLFSMLLAWLGDEKLRGRVFVVVCTNKPLLIDPAVIRRLENIFPVLPPLAIEDRIKMFKVHEIASGVKFAPEVDFEEVARLTPGYTGADIERVVLNAWNNALVNGIGVITNEILHESARSIRFTDPERANWIREALLATTDTSFIPPEYKSLADSLFAQQANQSALYVQGGDSVQGIEYERI